MAGKRLFNASLAVLGIVALLVGAYRLGSRGNGNSPEAIRAVMGERLTALEGIEGRLKRLEEGVASLSAALQADKVSTKGAAAPDADRWAVRRRQLAGEQRRHPVLPHRVAHRGGGTNPGQKLVVFARENRRPPRNVALAASLYSA